jgi:hypothetical protein
MRELLKPIWRFKKYELNVCLADAVMKDPEKRKTNLKLNGSSKAKNRLSCSFPHYFHTSEVTTFPLGTVDIYRTGAKLSEILSMSIAD